MVIVNNYYSDEPVSAAPTGGRNGEKMSLAAGAFLEQKIPIYIVDFKLIPRPRRFRMLDGRFVPDLARLLRDGAPEEPAPAAAQPGALTQAIRTALGQIAGFR